MIQPKEQRTNQRANGRTKQLNGCQLDLSLSFIDEVDNFIYEDANDTFMKDKEMRERLLNTNPNAFRDMVTTFLEANGRGYWDTDPWRFKQ